MLTYKNGWDKGIDEKITYQKRNKLHLVIIVSVLFIMLSFLLIATKVSTVTYVFTVIIAALGLFLQQMPLKTLGEKYKFPIGNSGVGIFFFGTILSIIFAVNQDIAHVTNSKFIFLDEIQSGLIFSENSRLVYQTDRDKRFESSLDPMAKPIGCLFSESFFC